MRQVSKEEFLKAVHRESDAGRDIITRAVRGEQFEKTGYVTEWEYRLSRKPFGLSWGKSYGPKASGPAYFLADHQ